MRELKSEAHWLDVVILAVIAALAFPLACGGQAEQPGSAAAGRSPTTDGSPAHSDGSPSFSDGAHYVDGGGAHVDGDGSFYDGPFYGDGAYGDGAYQDGIYGDGGFIDGDNQFDCSPENEYWDGGYADGYCEHCPCPGFTDGVPFEDGAGASGP